MVNISEHQCSTTMRFYFILCGYPYVVFTIMIYLFDTVYRYTLLPNVYYMQYITHYGLCGR